MFNSDTKHFLCSPPMLTINIIVVNEFTTVYLLPSFYKWCSARYPVCYTSTLLEKDTICDLRVECIVLILILRLLLEFLARSGSNKNLTASTFNPISHRWW
jgi:hypothetical protein